jgi:transposase-like protein
VADQRSRAGQLFPRSAGEFQAWFVTDADCLDYLEWIRWPKGFTCPRCENPGGWPVADGRYKCATCGARTSVTAGTLFDRRRTPLTVWFTACWMFAAQKDGVSALSLQRELEIGSYQTAWAMLHRLRSVLVRPGRDRLTGIVEVDEIYFGGEEPGLTGGRAKGKKVLVGVAVERKEPKGFGRCRMAVLADASAASLHSFIEEHVEPEATIVTDGWPGYYGIDRLGYIHDRHSQRAATARGEDIGGLLPGVHRVASLAKRWHLGTHQGRVDDAHLQSYLDEFVFRFNRRRSRSRGLVFYRLLELAVDHDPVRYRQLVANPKAKKLPPNPPGNRGHPPSMDRPPADRPWRRA